MEIGEIVRRIETRIGWVIPRVFLERYGKNIILYGEIIHDVIHDRPSKVVSFIVDSDKINSEIDLSPFERDENGILRYCGVEIDFHRKPMKYIWGALCNVSKCYYILENSTLYIESMDDLFNKKIKLYENNFERYVMRDILENALFGKDIIVDKKKSEKFHWIMNLLSRLLKQGYTIDLTLIKNQLVRTFIELLINHNNLSKDDIGIRCGKGYYLTESQLKLQDNLYNEQLHLDNCQYDYFLTPLH